MRLLAIFLYGISGFFFFFSFLYLIFFKRVFHSSSICSENFQWGYFIFWFVMEFMIRVVLMFLLFVSYFIVICLTLESNSASVLKDEIFDRIMYFHVYSWGNQVEYTLSLIW